MNSSLAERPSVWLRDKSSGKENSSISSHKDCPSWTTRLSYNKHVQFHASEREVHLNFAFFLGSTSNVPLIFTMKEFRNIVLCDELWIFRTIPSSICLQVPVVNCFPHKSVDCDSLRASSPIWASDASLGRTRERAAKPRGAEERRALLSSAPRSRVLATLASLAQIGELARRLGLRGCGLL